MLCSYLRASAFIGGSLFSNVETKLPLVETQKSLRRAKKSNVCNADKKEEIPQ